MKHFCKIGGVVLPLVLAGFGPGLGAGDALALWSPEGAAPIETTPPLLSAREAGGFRFECALLDGETFLRATRAGAPGRAGCLAGAGLLYEAHSLLRRNAAPGERSLRDVLSFILYRDDIARDRLVSEAGAGSAAAAMWLLAGGRGADAAALSPAMRGAAAARFANLPHWARAHFTVSFTEALIMAPDRAAAWKLAEALKARKDGINDIDGAAADADLAAYVKARVLEDRGDARAAAKVYQTVGAPMDEPLGAAARLKAAALLWRAGALPSSDLVAALEPLSLQPSDDALHATIELALARAYVFAGRRADAARKLSQLASPSTPQPWRDEAAARLNALGDEMYIRSPQNDPLPALIDIYALYRPSFGEGRRFWAGDLIFAGLLAEAGLHGRADRILGFLAADDVLDGAPPETALDAVEALVLLGATRRAQPFLDDAEEYARASKKEGAKTDASDAFGAPPDFNERLERLRPAVRPLEDYATAASIPQSAPARGVLAERAWRAGAWDVFRADPDLASVLDDDVEDRADDDVKAVSLARAANLARYLGDGARLDFADGASIDDPVNAALFRFPQTDVYDADDFRVEFRETDAILALEDLLAGGPSSQPLPKTLPRSDSDAAAPGPNKKADP